MWVHGLHDNLPLLVVCFLLGNSPAS
jgi:hypothetical protein